MGRRLKRVLKNSLSILALILLITIHSTNTALANGWGNPRDPEVEDPDFNFPTQIVEPDPQQA